jgi:2,4-didehydro-3-deoxy-L-rhamnonate hydrolase
MRLCRFNNEKLGLVEEDRILDVTPALQGLSEQRYPFPRYDLFISHLDKLGSAIITAAQTAPSFGVAEARLAAPVANPGKLIAALVNYMKHLEEARAQSALHHNNKIEEIQRAGLFLKATSSLVGASDGMTIRFPDRRNDHEIELAAIIGKTANRIVAAEAPDYVAGYTIGLDMTVRGPEERSLRKSSDSYSVLGPWMVTADEFGDPSAVDLTLSVNGQTRQQANTADLILDVGRLIEFASSFYTLYPGDVLVTGTPDGVGPVVRGDKISATISGIGTLNVAVA